MALLSPASMVSLVDLVVLIVLVLIYTSDKVSQASTHSYIYRREKDREVIPLTDFPH